MCYWSHSTTLRFSASTHRDLRTRCFLRSLIGVSSHRFSFFPIVHLALAPRTLVLSIAPKVSHMLQPGLHLRNQWPRVNRLFARGLVVNCRSQFVASHFVRTEFVGELMIVDLSHLGVWTHLRILVDSTLFLTLLCHQPQF